MAIKNARQFRGFPVPDCYHEIISVRIDKRRNAIIVGTVAWVDATKTNELPELGNTFSLPHHNAATVAWAYEQLKTLPEFAGAVDV